MIIALCRPILTSAKSQYIGKLIKIRQYKMSNPSHPFLMVGEIVEGIKYLKRSMWEYIKQSQIRTITAHRENTIL